MRTPPPHPTTHHPLPPFHTLKGEPDRPADRPENGVEEAGAAGGGWRRILCAACRHMVTTARARGERGGRHRHVFFNPHGLVFELGVFERAPGCAVAGPPETEFTWFPGHAWQPALCARCLAHLGWRFAPVANGGAASFFGLILAQLVEEEDSDGG